MASSLGPLPGRLRLRRATGLVAVTAVLALAGAPALAGADQLLPTPAQTGQPDPSSEDADDLPDAVHPPRSATARPGADPRRDRPACGPQAPSQLAQPARPAPDDPSGGGPLGIPLRC